MSSLILVPRAISLAYLLFFVSLTLTAFQSPAYSQQRKAEPKFTPAMQKVIGQAKAEGKVVFFTASTKRTADEAARLSQALQAYFGMPMKVDLASLGGTVKFVSRLREEARAGIKPPVDLLCCMNSYQVVWSRQDGIVHDVDWKALGVPASAYLSDVNAPLIEVNTRPFIYNTKLVKEADIPRKFEDLLHPRFKGRIVAPASPSIFPFLVPAMGEEAAIDFVKRLVEEQKLVLVPTFADTRQRVTNGEFLVGYGSDVADLSRKGAPIATAPLKHGGVPAGLVVVKNAPYPAAAQLLAYFLTSTPEGEKAAEEILEYTKPKPGTTDVVIVDAQWFIQHGKRLTDIFKNILKL
ncbi:MAG: extracellular solute-binding protein [Deltaproteobacteria bacterium]|nr:extracellular solute-binding protein [Deltaproteobacteria bacterium]